jgi:hypothetical protein
LTPGSDKTIALVARRHATVRFLILVVARRHATVRFLILVVARRHATVRFLILVVARGITVVPATLPQQRRDLLSPPPPPRQATRGPRNQHPFLGGVASTDVRKRKALLQHSISEAPPLPPRVVPVSTAKSDRGSSLPCAASACWGGGGAFLQGRTSSVELDLIFGSHLTRGGCSAAPSASTVPGLSAGLRSSLGGGCWGSAWCATRCLSGIAGLRASKR